MNRKILLAVPLLLITGLEAQVKVPKAHAELRFGSHLAPAAITAMQSISPENIEQQTRFLSHDFLEGST